MREAGLFIQPKKRSLNASRLVGPGNLRACQLLLSHWRLEITARYSGSELDDVLVVSERIDL